MWLLAFPELFYFFLQHQRVFPLSTKLLLRPPWLSTENCSPLLSFPTSPDLYHQYPVFLLLVLAPLNTVHVCFLAQFIGYCLFLLAKNLSCPKTEMSACFVYWYRPKYWSVPEMWQDLSKNLKDVKWVKLEKSWMKIFPKSFLLPVFLTIIFWIECKLWGQEVGVVILNYSLLSFYRRVRLFSFILGPTRMQVDGKFEFWCQLSLWYQMTWDSFSPPCRGVSHCFKFLGYSAVDLGKTREGSLLYSCLKEDKNYLWDHIF